MEDRELFERGLRSQRRAYMLASEGAPENRLLAFDGVIATISPGAPGRSVMNSVLYETPEALEHVLDELAHEYEDAGILAWTVWVPEHDRRSAEFLERAGHKLDAAPRAMGFELERLGDPPDPEPEWTGDWSRNQDAWLVNDRAYGDPDGMLARVLGELPAGSAHLYLSYLDGKPASFVMVHDHEGDCGFWFAATVPEARGKGLAGGLLHKALSDARDRGCTTTTTQATKMGAPVYERIGYRDLGALEMWERRKPGPS